jgi:hypothetical protein
MPSRKLIAYRLSSFPAENTERNLSLLNKMHDGRSRIALNVKEQFFAVNRDLRHVACNTCCQCAKAFYALQSSSASFRGSE